jgi:plasmid stabilization system protein ParE
VTYAVRFSPAALDQLADIENHIGAAGSPDTAARFVDAIVAHCERLATFPTRGLPRDDLMLGLRITTYRRRVVIAFLVEDEARAVSIVGVYYGGQDYETRFLSDMD